MPFKIAVPNSAYDVSNVGIALYNSLGEYPANYIGLRFFDDQAAFKYASKKAKDNLKDDRVFKVIYNVSQHGLFPGFFRPMTDYHLVTLLYIREVIMGNPILYANRIISRIFMYLPSHPFIACITHFFTHNPNGNSTMIGYRSY